MQNETLEDYFEVLEDRFYYYYLDKYESHMKNAKSKSHVFRLIYLKSTHIPAKLENMREKSVLMAYIENKYLAGGISLDNILSDLKREAPESIKLTNRINIVYRTWRTNHEDIMSSSFEEGTVDLNKYSDRRIVKEFAKFKTWQKIHIYLEKRRKYFLNEKDQELTETEMEAIRKKEPMENDEESKNPDYTTARRVLAMRYMFMGLGIEVGEGNYSAVARFIQFMTGSNYASIYKKVCSPLKKEGKKANDDFRYVRELFEDMEYLKFEELILKDRKT